MAQPFFGRLEFPATDRGLYLTAGAGFVVSAAAFFFSQMGFFLKKICGAAPPVAVMANAVRDNPGNGQSFWHSRGGYVLQLCRLGLLLPVRGGWPCAIQL